MEAGKKSTLSVTRSDYRMGRLRAAVAGRPVRRPEEKQSEVRRPSNLAHKDERAFASIHRVSCSGSALIPPWVTSLPRPAHHGRGRTAAMSPARAPRARLIATTSGA